MSATHEHEIVDEATPTSDLIFREYAAELSPGEGRTLDVRIVPYGERIIHRDGHGGRRMGEPYSEEFVAGAFAPQVNARGRENQVLVNFEHQEGIGGIVGHGVALLEREDGLYGSFVLHETAEGDKALMMVRNGILDTVSLEAKPLKSVRTRDGIVQRVRAHLVGIALTRFGAYKGARVLALREEAIVDEALMPTDLDPVVIQRCRMLGVRLPARYQAHPDNTGTASDDVTPEDGTGHANDNTSSEEA